MNKWLCLFVLFLSVLSFGQITVEVNDEQVYNASMLGLRMRVVNNSGQSYDNVTVDFYLKKNPSETFALDSYYTENWTISIAEQSGENVIIRATIPHLGAGTSPNSSGVSVGIHRTDWQPMSKTSANGFPLGSTFTTALNYNVFQGNNLIGGSSYIDPSLIVPSLRFVGLQPTPYGNIPSWIEIENYGTTPANLSNISLKWATSTGTSSSSVSSAVLEPGKRLRICPTQLNCPDDDLVAAVPMLQDVQGEILLRYNTTIMDYLSWGDNDGVLASDARLANIQYSRIRYDFGFYDEYWHKVEPGIFYKKIDGKWYSYTPNYDVNTMNTPDPVSYFEHETLCLEGNDPTKDVRFAWRPVEDAKGYIFSVRKTDGTFAYSTYVEQVFYDMELGEGTYEWNVEVKYPDEQYTVSNPWIDHYTVWKTKIIEDCGIVTKEVYLQVPQYGVHKDTRMLVPNWGALADFPEISWDHPDVFIYNRSIDPWFIDSSLPPNMLLVEVFTRCWSVAIQIINASYGGNLTQDEIKFYGKTVGFDKLTTVRGTQSRPERDKIIAPFVLGPAGGGYPPEVYETLKWALQIGDSQLEHGTTSNNRFDPNFVVAHIDEEQPIYYSNGPHAMVVDGYRYTTNGFQIHVVNLYNGGESEWYYNDNLYLDCYFVANIPKNDAHPLMTDPLVHQDSDEDGIVDFDEIVRFNTNPYSDDSDGDGVKDKDEIFSYTIREPVFKPVQVPVGDPEKKAYDTRNLSMGEYMYKERDEKGKPIEYAFGDILRLETLADIDGDGLRAEKDEDSDHPNNDGLPDGAEDLNHNGYVDHGESDPYNFSDDYATNFNPVETVIWDAPSLVGIYAFEGINVGDNVTCNSGMHGFCQVASEYDVPYYSISVGANSTIGDVFSKGGVLLRDNAHVVGDASIYSLPTASISPEMYSNASVSGMTSVKNVGEWPYAVSDNLHHSLDGKENWSDMIVEFGQTVTLNSNIPYKNLIVRPGGTLKLGAGTIYVGNITLESGSKLEFLNPGRETVIVADGFLNWRAQILNSDLQTVAKGFKLIEYAPGYIHIEGDWAGTIHARWCELTLGQVKKTAYGSFVAKKVYLGNGLTIYRIHFSPIPLTDMV